MIDAFYIFTKGGLLLWSTQLVKVKGDPVDKLIKEVLLEERVGETFANLESYSMKWRLLNEMDLFFVVVYQGILQIAYLESLLLSVSKEFLKHVTNGISNTLALSPPYKVNFDDDFRKVLMKVDKEQREAKRRPQMKSFEQTKKGQEVLKNKGENGNTTANKKKPKSGKGDDDDDEEDGEEDEAAEPEVDPEAVAQARKKLMAKAKNGPSKKEEPKEEEPPAETTKKAKQARHWDTNAKVTKAVMKELDFSKPRRDDQPELSADALEAQKALFMDGDDDPAFNDEEASSLGDDESDAEKDGEAKTGRMGGLFKTLTRSVKNITGGAVLGEEDLAPILSTFKTALMTRNVAAEVSDKLADSVRASLIGKTTGRFQSMTATVKAALQDAMETLLTPKKSVDVLRAAMAAKSAGRVYSIVFLGVNGVGKSTNLAKVAYYLKHKGNLNVLICACDTFRAGAVEQLKTHSRCLDVPLFERGYGKDPAEIARGAIAHARETGTDVVLIDTAGRMQDNEPLMRALAKLVAMNQPDLVLFVGEALVGNDAIDQVTKFNRSLIDMSHDPRKPRGIDGMLLTKYDTVDDKVGAALSMVYVTGQPIIFVGCGQKYTHLRKMQAKEVVKTLLG